MNAVQPVVPLAPPHRSVCARHRSCELGATSVAKLNANKALRTEKRRRLCSRSRPATHPSHIFAAKDEEDAKCKGNTCFVFLFVVFFKKRKRPCPDLPGPEVGGVRVSVVQGQEVVLLLDGEGQEHELDAAPLLAHDHPGAVGPVRVAVGEARRLDAAVAALQRAAAGVDEACGGRQRDRVLV